MLELITDDPTKPTSKFLASTVIINKNKTGKMRPSFSNNPKPFHTTGFIQYHIASVFKDYFNNPYGNKPSRQTLIFL